MVLLATVTGQKHQKMLMLQIKENYSLIRRRLRIIFQDLISG